MATLQTPDIDALAGDCFFVRMPTLDDTLGLVAVLVAVLFLWYCPLFTPYFGFRRPRSSHPPTPPR